MMDFAFLRQQGIQELERMTGRQWTDFNVHDPGITILEQLCYALSDLSYRTDYDIPDLLADGGGDPYSHLHAPAEILTCRPVTPADLRRLVLDVEGVSNAWVEPIEEGAEGKLQLYYYPAQNEQAEENALSVTSGGSAWEPVKLKGLYRVLIDASADKNPIEVQADVARRLHDNRGLCEDFTEVTPLGTQDINVYAKVEIGLLDDADRVRSDILDALAAVISPPIRCSTLEEMLDAGKPLDEIFDGPRLARGFITDEALESATRRTVINTSDLIRAIKDVAGVRAVSRIRIGGTETEAKAWSLEVSSGCVAKRGDASRIDLIREGKDVTGQTTPSGQTAAPALSSASGKALALPPGRNRNAGRYTSVEQQFPALYGIGELGLPSSASPARKAQAKQLKAYLSFFDQLMANYLAQLAHVKDLFAYDSADTQTYFAQEPDPEGGMSWKSVEPSQTGDVEERKNRFLNHLLARFAEVLDEPRGKQEFLRKYPRLGGARGTALNYLKPAGPDNRSGLEERIRLKLGLIANNTDDDETFVLVEHILLRPMDGDEYQNVPLLADPMHRDPYSLQLTFVFPDKAGQKDNFKQDVEQAIRSETPAHLTPYVLWLAAPAEGSIKDSPWGIFQAAHAEWLAIRRKYWAKTLGVTLEDLGG